MIGKGIYQLSQEDKTKLLPIYEITRDKKENIFDLSSIYHLFVIVVSPSISFGKHDNVEFPSIMTSYILPPPTKIAK